MPDYEFMVTVRTETYDHAKQVIAERVDFYEDLGFAYDIWTGDSGWPTIKDHFARQHPDEMIELDIWWDQPEHHLGFVDGLAVLRIDTIGKMTDEDSENEYHCGLCSERLRLGDLEVEYVL